MSVEAAIGHYRLVERIAHGAFGALWRAADRIPGKELSIRVVSPQAQSADAIAAFEDEMTSAMAVRHHGLSRVYEVGRGTDGSVWAASEFVVGDSLEGVLAEGGPLSPIAALGIFSELAGALSELHSHRVVHGSLSARSVLIHRAKSGAMRPKVIGLGRARLVPVASQGRTAVPPEGPYSSPEMVASRGYGAASDVWALGVLLFHCVTGRPPFAARTASSFLAETRGAHRLLDTIEDEVVRGLVEQCLALAPEDRPTAAALVKQAELAGWIEQSDEQSDVQSATPTAEASATVEPVAAPLDSPPATAVAPIDEPAPIASPAPVVEAQALADAPDVSVDFRPRRRGATAVIAMVVATVALFAVFMATRQPRHRPPPTAAVVVVTTTPSMTAPESRVEAPAAAIATAAPVVASTVVRAPAIKPPPAVAANAKPIVQKPVDDNPYE